jgi:hypothetical protein
MRCTVTLLRRHGQRLKKHELGVPIERDLELTDQAFAAEFKRLARAANLWVAHLDGTRRSLLPPLWEPRVIQIGPNFLTILGTEIATVQGRVHDHLQIWRCLTSLTEGK